MLFKHIVKSFKHNVGDLEPGEDGPHAVLLADVIRARPERLLAADEGRVPAGEYYALNI